ncbi:FAD-binding oxidoreductase [Paraburkholderia sp. BL25I1N1]|uniref:NAD(P)/FAD-dependent oxidoreductase n=1 Tax=Paraburkholderia sp. BL25I1N1 TaxID=1938804 RepID=UPI000D065D0E|nr:FAD-binding oxidoreductase [Paraburkholderia sp. BL25I1N1]PRY05947.1 D-amino-acid dehydrogenase [Paraburkholderia sp. BL25I1N1]
MTHPKNNGAASRGVTVLGAGIVGLSIALKLHLDGFKVTVVEKGEPMHGTSYGNAGYLSEANIFPPASPHMLRQLPKFMLSKEGPLVIKPDYATKMIPWAIKAVAALKPASYQDILTGLASLTTLAYESFDELLTAANAQQLLTREGGLVAFRTLAGLQAKCRSLPIWNSFGLAAERISAELITEMEPELSKDMVGGIFFKNSGRCSNPRGLGELYVKRLRKAGVEFNTDEVRGIENVDSGVRIHTASGSFVTDRVVLTMGFQTGALLQRLDIKVPLVSERGYHLMLPSSDVRLKRPIVFGEPHFAATPMDEGLRLAGTAEFARADSQPNMDRAWMLLKLAKRYLPNVNEADATPWMGVRPSLPDGLPAIGLMRNAPRIAYAFGHAHNGLTLSAITARCVSALMQGKEAPVDLEPYRLERFLHHEHATV